MQNAFNEAVSADLQENHHDEYDDDDNDYDNDDDIDFDDEGEETIATTELTKDATEDYQKSGKALEKFIEDVLATDDIGTRECWGIKIKEGSYVFFGWSEY